MGYETRHVTVLRNETVEGVMAELSADSRGVVVDGTLGGGGHLQRALEYLDERRANEVTLVAFDRDPLAVQRAEDKFSSELADGRVRLVNAPFSSISENLLQQKRLLGFYADLGFSSDQIETGERGMSFLREGPLDMRMDTTRGEPVSTLLARVSEPELTKILQEWGEERFSDRIARYWVHDRSLGKQPKTTTELAEWMERIIPRKFHERRIHPATRTFQALRIWVNDEIEELKRGLEAVYNLLEVGGRMGFISFHSLEDREVKRFFSHKEKEGSMRRVTKKAIVPSEAEVSSNPRARSAKLRIGEKK